MSERNKEKQRQCKHCSYYFPTTAKGIKDHAAECAEKKREADATRKA